MLPAASKRMLPQLLLTLLIFCAAPLLLSPVETQSQAPDCSQSPVPGAKLDLSEPYGWVRQTPLIAHALGGIGGFAGTNSREAMLQAYACGYRVFETDVSVTSDGHLALRHDWDAGTYPVLGQTPPAKERPMPLAKFRALPIQGHYTPATFKDALAFMADHPDMLLITDTKEPDPAKAAAVFQRIVAEAESVDPRLLDRIVPQLYEADNYEAVKSVHPFKQYIYTLYLNKDSDEQVLRDVAARGIRIVVMDENRYSPDFVKALKREGAYAYVNTINDVGRIRELMADGAQGVMTDFIVPSALS
ncbi:glycerophosphoryl diester phosphodiesterase [Paenibacillus sp. UNC496MF]|uniref:phosphatidylinositol-specific phospholipase C/glycerophosphodiester phosphodiesterase family protein n=1 Tax=Paenibacillus sp. UNC496MF TaxID=1502753 RepID=UPI0008F3493C|nr:phosphatidylinositol-specific phospholipase C/glycerophosphodiester phosphodiesterase family protein [Paenibacillus sp. UNC496MF]SFJ68687.1 glycerophosphoryl diester phosphodiesterase [Paenibacillus sp. UNC496MF]